MAISTALFTIQKKKCLGQRYPGNAHAAAGIAHIHTFIISLHLFVRIKYSPPQSAKVMGIVICSEAAIEQQAKQTTNRTPKSLLRIPSLSQSSISNINHKISETMTLNERAFPDHALTKNHHSLLVPAESSAV